ncbi:MAG: peptidylprolyl isomerase [Myxococcota bacterium]|nr:peptidylprolyl isomerase [Myxococcota bacterium]
MRCPNRSAGGLTWIRAVLSAMLLLLPIGCGSGQVESEDRTQADLISLSDPVSMPKAKPLPPEYEVTARVEIKTSLGSFVVGLYGNDAPRTVENFLKYVADGFYQEKIFHRVITGFMIQGGGFDTDLKRVKTDLPLDLEIIPGLKHEPGVISMARTDDPNSATSQFFVCTGDGPQLNGTYAAFGKVEQGIDVVRAISMVPTKAVETAYGSMTDVPVDQVIIESVTLL